MFPDLQFSITVYMDFNDNTSVFDKNSTKLITVIARGSDANVWRVANSGPGPSRDPGGHKSYISYKELQNLNAPGDETSRFLEDFDPSRRRSDKTKKDSPSPSYIEDDNIKKLPSHQSQRKEEKKDILFDNKGVMLHNQRDLCDCLREACPGCHFRCPKCQSPKCGHECRNNRRWEYDFVEVDGDPGAFRENEFKAKPDDSIRY